MEKTLKLYYEDIHKTDFSAKVLDCINLADGTFEIILDQTAFFPEEGGQKADSGRITASRNEDSPMEILDVQIRDDIIYHKTAAGLPAGTVVTGQVNWQKRFDFMQQHTGEHLLSGLVHTYYGFRNVGFHLGEEEVTLDFDGILTLEQLRVLEQEVNRAIALNLPVLIRYPSNEELACLEYRSKIEILDAVRIVEIPGYDVCACCAPHVDFTGQIGLLKVTGVQKHRGGVRINILCGTRALQDYTEKQNSVSSISVQLSAKSEMIADAVARLKEENLRQKNRMIALQQQFLQLQLSQVPVEQEDVVLFFDDLDTPAMRDTVNTLCETHPGYCAVFTGNDTDGYRYILGSLHQNCREAAALLSEKLGAKGGGSERMVQGRLKASREKIRALNLQTPMD